VAATKGRKLKKEDMIAVGTILKQTYAANL
jgi:hypothetical protein